MKTLFLMRHAKSSWDDDDLRDVDRPLAPRGMRDARKMGKRLAKRDKKIDLILSSPAVRARATAQLLAKKLGYKPKKIIVDDRLYAATERDLLAVIRALDNKLRRVILVGHNPELTALARRFSSDITQLPTSAIAEFKFDTRSWSDVAKDRLVKVARFTQKRNEKQSEH